MSAGQRTPARVGLWRPAGARHTEAVRSISSGRRSPRLPRFCAFIRSCTFVVGSGCWPVSRSPWRVQRAGVPYAHMVLSAVALITAPAIHHPGAAAQPSTPLAREPHANAVSPPSSPSRLRPFTGWSLGEDPEWFPLPAHARTKDTTCRPHDRHSGSSHQRSRNAWAGEAASSFATRPPRTAPLS